MSDTKYLVITGLSGSGKSLIHNSLEDIGYYCVDNLPIGLMGKFFELISETSRGIKRAAIVTDVREQTFLTGFVRAYAELRGKFAVELIFLEASEDVLIQRFSETRRPHPLAGGSGGSLKDALRLERDSLAPIRALADQIVDTSRFNVHELHRFIRGSFGPEHGTDPMVVSVESFGFKHGIPREADLVFDVRFLSNPHFQAELREFTGLDQPVIEFVRSQVETDELLTHLTTFVHYLLPKYAREGKAYLTIGVGCTGGRHRSVVVAAELAARLGEFKHEIAVRHRDIERR